MYMVTNVTYYSIAIRLIQSLMHLSVKQWSLGNGMD